MSETDSPDDLAAVVSYPEPFRIEEERPAKAGVVLFVLYVRSTSTSHRSSVTA